MPLPRLSPIIPDLGASGTRWGGPGCKFKSLTAHAADPDSNLIITLATEGLFQKIRCRLKAIIETVLLIMVLGSNSKN